MTETATAPFTVTMDGPTWLALETRLEGVAPAEALTWVTRPDKLRQWWGQEHEIDPVPGGAYIVRWPAMGWTMRGEIASVSEAQLDALLISSWSWDHEPDLPARTVIVRATEFDGGS